MKIYSFGLTDKGVARERNEDSFAVDEENGLFVVCDGVGGLMAGEVASRLAVEVIGNYFKQAGGEGRKIVGVYDKGASEAANELASAIRLANRTIHEASQSNPSYRGMGSTVVAAIIAGDEMSIAHVGDSRLYLVRSGSIEQLTDDHSLVQEQVKKGLISEADARGSGVRNIITRALGVNETVEVDLDGIRMMDGDRFILCSDGLSTMVTDETMLSVVSTEDRPDRACMKLIDLANEHGGKDNITVILIYIYKKGILWYIKSLAMK